MSPADPTGVAVLTEECIEELDELVMSLDRYPPTAVAVALGTHLAELLAALREQGACTEEEIHELLREVELGALKEDRAA